ncbi:hypothetical protein ATCV1_z252L [Acanthocystis turfacea chlorella virus 1]|uniref:Uncharacterized protein z252L n=1 Tax=Chlorovirus heliozoae TaxID=322019 RepID=A7K8L2_9PHYC|nr:hypothetical protein ATCV1_z252L [Acanthocystis turfacea chlorella virus 1]ABT16386.1 hypothetical protein ATCV1_z252L [Acanthocystis turfacea chlorella virus 1]
MSRQHAVSWQHTKGGRGEMYQQQKQSGRIALHTDSQNLGVCIFSTRRSIDPSSIICLSSASVSGDIRSSAVPSLPSLPSAKSMIVCIARGLFAFRRASSTRFRISPKLIPVVIAIYYTTILYLFYLSILDLLAGLCYEHPIFLVLGGTIFRERVIAGQGCNDTALGHDTLVRLEKVADGREQSAAILVGVKSSVITSERDVALEHDVVVLGEELAEGRGVLGGRGHC